MNKERRKTRQEISEQLESLKSDLASVQSDEEEYRDNIPENMQSGERYERAEAACDSLAEAVSQLEDAISSIETAME